MEDVMVRISILWISFAVDMAAHYAMLAVEPSALQKVLSEESAIPANALAIIEAFTNWLIPLTMAFLSVTLDGLSNRYLNMVLGGFFTLMGIFHIARCPIVHISKDPSVHQLLLCILAIMVTALIFWYAWNW